ncbi:hypothetical protein GCM10009646_21450 [Streptomyces aureus]
MQGDAQAAERGGRVGVGPADVHGLFAVEAVAGGDREEFDEGAGAGAWPSFGEGGAAVASEPKAAEKV